jgi:Chaperone of endosialidase
MTVGVDSGNRFSIYNQSSTGVYLTDGVTSWTAGSDMRLKKNIKTLAVLDRLKDYRAVSFDWKANGSHDVGVVAQELYKAFPEVVDKGSASGIVTKMSDPGAWGVRYDKLGAFALEGLKELKAIFDSDHDSIAKLKADNDNLSLST